MRLIQLFVIGSAFIPEICLRVRYVRDLSDSENWEKLIKGSQYGNVRSERDENLI